MTYLWDTDTFSGWHRGSGPVLEHIRSLAPDDVILLPAVAAHEALRGRLAVVAQARDERRYVRALAALTDTLAGLRSWRIVPYTSAAAEILAELRAGRGHYGKADLRIAATALSIGAILVSRNAAHFDRLPGLKAVNWLD